MKTKLDAATAVGAEVAHGAPQLKGGHARRLALLNAVVDVVAEKGIEGVTHRAVAEAAGVPLGATTYYFSDKDQLIVGAMQLVDERSVANVQEILDRSAEAGLDVVQTMTNLTVELSVRERELLIIGYRFALAGLSRVGLNEASKAVQLNWYGAVEAYLSERVDPVAVQLFLLFLEGVALRTVSLGEQRSTEEIETLCRRILAPLS